ncbi:MAG: hypothetical protein AAF434_20335 [Pseudomonadota bacterium]
MLNIVRASVFLLPFLCVFMAPQIALSEDCTKLIFKRYCLGGSVATLPDGVSEAIVEDGSPGTRFTDTDGDRIVDITAVDGRIARISRRQPPGNWLHFTEWKTKLVRLYGRGEDRSSFPAYAGSRSSKLNAINAGRGSALIFWQQLGWSVSLRWDHRDYITLDYELDSSNRLPEDDEGL